MAAASSLLMPPRSGPFAASHEANCLIMRGAAAVDPEIAALRARMQGLRYDNMVVAP